MEGRLGLLFSPRTYSFSFGKEERNQQSKCGHKSQEDKSFLKRSPQDLLHSDGRAEVTTSRRDMNSSSKRTSKGVLVRPLPSDQRTRKRHVVIALEEIRSNASSERSQKDHKYQ